MIFTHIDLVRPASQLSLDGTFGLSPEEVTAGRAREAAMRAADGELREQLAARNALESFVLEMRGAPRRKHGDKIDSAALTKLLDASEEWMYDHENSSLAELKAKVGLAVTYYFTCISLIILYILYILFIGRVSAGGGAAPVRVILRRCRS